MINAASDVLSSLFSVGASEVSAPLRLAGVAFNIALIIALAIGAWLLLRRVIRSRLLSARLVVGPERSRALTRVATLRRLLEDVVRYTLVIYASYLILRELGLDLTPVLATVGVVGIAISLGAQSLVKDMLTGLFLLFEDQLHIGDFVEIVGVPGAGGIVEDFGLRATHIRDIEGELHFVPNGQIGAINRFTHGFVTYYLDFRLPPSAAREIASEAIREAAADVARQIDLFTAAPRTIDDTTSESGLVRLSVEVVPLSYWVIEKELAPRCQNAARAALGSEIPAPTVFRLPTEVMTYRRRLLGFASAATDTGP